MKGYLLFAAVDDGLNVITRGGWQDFKGAFDYIEDVRRVVQRSAYDWWHIVDLTTLSIIDRSKERWEV